MTLRLVFAIAAIACGIIVLVSATANHRVLIGVGIICAALAAVIDR